MSDFGQKFMLAKFLLSLWAAYCVKKKHPFLFSCITLRSVNRFSLHVSENIQTI